MNVKRELKALKNIFNPLLGPTCDCCGDGVRVAKKGDICTDCRVGMENASMLFHAVRKGDLSIFFNHVIKNRS